MKHWKKILTMALLIASVQTGAVFAEEKPGMDVYMNVASSYFFRGAHVYSAATKEYDATKSTYKDDVAFPLAPSLQSGFTFYAPLKGLSFDVWSAFALTNRKAATVTNSGDTADHLSSVDEVDFTVAYEFDNKVGTWKIFLISYLLPNDSSTQFTEFGFSYTAPLPLSPTLYFANNVSGPGTGSAVPATYMSLNISHELKFAKTMSLTPGLTYGYTRAHGSTMELGKGYLQFDLGFSVAVGAASISLSPAVIYQLDSDAKPSTQAYVSLGVSYSL